MNRNITSILLYAIASLLLVCSCKNDTKQSDLLSIDMEEKYPLKEVFLQDIAEVKYIALETSDEVLCSDGGEIKYIDNDYILFVNNIVFGDGNMFIFDGSGKIISKINHKGQGPEEYRHASRVVFDKEKQEVYVSDMNDRIFVYDLFGKFKRKLSLKFKEEDNKDITSGYYFICNFDKDHLLYYVVFWLKEQDSYTYSSSKIFLVSKQNGEFMKEIPFYYDQNVSFSNMTKAFSEFGQNFPFYFMQYNHVYLNLPQNNILYRITPDFSLEPLIRGSQIKDVLSGISAETVNYRYMTLAKDAEEFSMQTLCFDKQLGTVSKWLCYNHDDKKKTPVEFGLRLIDDEWSLGFIRPADDNRYYAIYQPFDLKEANENGKLQGELQDIATRIGEDDNPVVMVVKFK
jgi:hypothetical protein